MLEARRKRLSFRAHRRGFRELDLIMGAFADARLASMDERDLDEFEALLDLPDQDVYAWITGQTPAPLETRSAVLDALLAFRYPGRSTI
jgi:antitoxin CptB